MEHPDAIAVDVDKVEVIHLLEHEVAGIVEDVASRVIVETFRKHFESDTVVQILSRMDFETKVDSLLVKGIQNRSPPPRQLVECRVNQT